MGEGAQQVKAASNYLDYVGHGFEVLLWVLLLAVLGPVSLPFWLIGKVAAYFGFEPDPDDDGHDDEIHQ